MERKQFRFIKISELCWRNTEFRSVRETQAPTSLGPAIVSNSLCLSGSIKYNQKSRFVPLPFPLALGHHCFYTGNRYPEILGRFSPTLLFIKCERYLHIYVMDGRSRNDLLHSWAAWANNQLRVKWPSRYTKANGSKQLTFACLTTHSHERRVFFFFSILEQNVSCQKNWLQKKKLKKKDWKLIWPVFPSRRILCQCVHVFTIILNIFRHSEEYKNRFLSQI